MENIQQPKNRKVNVLYVGILILGGMIILLAVLFYFLPIPKDLDKVVKSGAKIERCISNREIVYKAVFQLESFRGGIFSTIIYNKQGEKICSSGGYSNATLDKLCKVKMCFPIHDN